MFLPTDSQLKLVHSHPPAALRIDTAPRAISGAAQLVVHVSRGRLVPKDGTNVTLKMGRSDLGYANIPCYTQTI
jgi:hypothetical protein